VQTASTQTTSAQAATRMKSTQTTTAEATARMKAATTKASARMKSATAKAACVKATAAVETTKASRPKIVGAGQGQKYNRRKSQLFKTIHVRFLFK
jgi:hypothetical protein